MSDHGLDGARNSGADDSGVVSRMVWRVGDYGWWADRLVVVGRLGLHGSM